MSAFASFQIATMAVTFTAPEGTSLNSVLWVIAAAVIVLRIIPFIITQQLDRSRIRKVIATCGGQIRKISWKPFGRGWIWARRGRIRIYDVTYRNLVGRNATDTCKTSMPTGVTWIVGDNSYSVSDAPPGAGVITCPSCHAFIPENGHHCTACGWSTQGATAGAPVSLMSLLEQGWTNCLECGGMVPPDGSACSKCGSRGGKVRSAAKQLKTVFTGLFMTALGGYFLWRQSILPWQSGVLKAGRGTPLYREDSPFQFWFQVVGMGLGTSLVIGSVF